MHPPTHSPCGSSCHSLEVQQGRRYLLCTCGLSTKKPLCNGAHAGSGHLPDFHTATASGRLDVCYGGKSSRLPLCDGRACNSDGTAPS